MKVTFITGHNWVAKRQGGFHKFAEYCVQQGFKTVFFSFPRPYYGLFTHREDLNREIIKSLSKGKLCDVENTDYKILNVAFPTFRIPDGIANKLPSSLVKFLATHSLKSFKSFSKKILTGTDVFVFESCEGIYLLDPIKKLFPDAKIVYRPSDPLTYDSCPQRLKNAEEKILLEADISLVVNKEGVETYSKMYKEFSSKAKFEVFTNGLDTEAYKKSYPKPEMLEKKNTVLYVGAWGIEWPLIFKAAEERRDYNFIIVNPNRPSEDIIEKAEKTSNVFYVPGITPKEVPQWVTNADVYVVPYVTDFYKDRPLGITAKYYQAMQAGRFIVAYSDTEKLKDVGIPVTYTYEDFIGELDKAFEKINAGEKPVYNFNFDEKDWGLICARFVDIIKKL